MNEIIKNGYSVVQQGVRTAADAVGTAAEFVGDEITACSTRDLILFGVLGAPVKRRVCEYLNRHLSVEVDVR